MTPPRLWSAVLAGSLPRRDREPVLDELRRIYAAKRELLGRRAANAWYRAETLNFLLRVPLERIRRRVPSKESLVGELFNGLQREIRLAVRSLAAQPGITGVAILALVLGVGANTLIFSVVDHVILRPLPYPQPDRLVDVWPQTFMLRGELGVYEERVQSAEALAGYLLADGFNAELTDGSRRLSGNFVSPELLTVLGVQPALGRNFLPEADRVGNHRVAMLSQRFWRTEFGADPGTVGRTLVLDGEPHEIVGVLPAGFAFPERDQDVLVPYLMNPDDAGGYWGSGGYRVVARLRPGATPLQLRDELYNLSLEARLMNPLWTPREDFRAETTVVPLRDSMVAGVESNLFVLLGAVGLVLLVACANVANLLLARGLARGHDLAVRAAIGASRRRLLRQQLVESLVLIGIGCAIAVIFAWRALDLMVSMLPAEIPRATEIALDGRILAISVGTALLVGLLASFVPAVRAAGADPGAAMREGGRGGGTSSRRRRLSAVMVVAQVAGAVVLVTGAGLLTRSLVELGQVDPGFVPDGVTTARITLNPDDYATDTARLQFFNELTAAVGDRPGVSAAGVAGHVPFGPGWGGMATFIENVTEDPNALPVIRHTEVTPGYFDALGIPLLRGRDIAATDGPDTRLVAVIDEAMAAEYWPDADPLGKRIRYPWRGAPWITIVGVVGGTAESSLGEPRAPAYYVPLGQRPPFAANLVARTAGGEGLTVAALRDIVQGIDPGAPVSGVGPLATLLGSSLARARWSASLLGGFAVMTLLLGCIGVYGVVAYSVGERTRDIGVQMALGAAPGRIRRGVLRHGLALAVPGAALGLLVAVPASRGLQNLLYGVRPTDPVTFAAVPVLLVLTTLAAVYVPARRATSVDPSLALRSDT